MYSNALDPEGSEQASAQTVGEDMVKPMHTFLLGMHITSEHQHLQLPSKQTILALSRTPPDPWIRFTMVGTLHVHA